MMPKTQPDLEVDPEPAAEREADEVAHRIGGDEKGALREEIERQFDSEQQREYDDKRWGIDIATEY